MLLRGSAVTADSLAHRWMDGWTATYTFARKNNLVFIHLNCCEWRTRTVAPAAITSSDSAEARQVMMYQCIAMREACTAAAQSFAVQTTSAILDKRIGFADGGLRSGRRHSCRSRLFRIEFDRSGLSCGLSDRVLMDVAELEGLPGIGHVPSTQVAGMWIYLGCGLC